MTLQEWVKSGEYLPLFMRDFHDQKRIFKRIDEVIQAIVREGPYQLPNWVSAHIYVVDYFLWFMARRGYTLQRSRKRVDFVNMEQDLSEFEKREIDVLRGIIAAQQPHAGDGATGAQSDVQSLSSDSSGDAASSKPPSA